MAKIAKIDYRPTYADFEYIYQWMKTAFEQEVKGGTLFYNINIIEAAFQKHRVCVLRINGKVEGFITHLGDENKRITFEIISINPEFHHRGLGQYFQTAVIEHFKKKGMLMAVIYEPSNKGLRLSNKLAFKPMYDWMNDKPDKHNRYTYLVPRRRQCWKAKTRLVLWQGEVSLDRLRAPDMSWSLDFSRDKKPILQHTNQDFYLGIVENGVVMYLEKVKYFMNGIWFPSDQLLYIPRDILLSVKEHYNGKSALLPER